MDQQTDRQRQTDKGRQTTTDRQTTIDRQSTRVNDRPTIDNDRPTNENVDPYVGVALVCYLSYDKCNDIKRTQIVEITRDFFHKEANLAFIEKRI